MTAAEAAERAASYSMTSAAARLAMAQACTRVTADAVAGDIVECGVWRGGNIIIARLMAPDRVCWLYDTFTGMTEPGPDDISRKGKIAIQGYERRREAAVGWCEASLDEVRASLAEAHVYDEARLRFIPGDVCDTLRVPANLPARIAVLRLDTDWYASTMAELRALWPRLAPGGTLIIDDYGHWRGCRKAVDEFFGRHKPNFEKLDYTAVMTVRPC